MSDRAAIASRLLVVALILTGLTIAVVRADHGHTRRCVVWQPFWDMVTPAQCVQWADA